MKLRFKTSVPSLNKRSIFGNRTRLLSIKHVGGIYTFRIVEKI